MPDLSKFEKQVEGAIQAQQMLSPGEKVIVGVSGGPDSVALLSVLVALRPSWDLCLWVVHCNHGITRN